MQGLRNQGEPKESRTIPCPRSAAQLSCESKGQQLAARQPHASPPHLLLFKRCFESSHRAQHFHRARLPSTSQNNGWLTRAVAAGRVCVLQNRHHFALWSCFNSALRGQGANSRCHLWEIPGSPHSDAQSVPLWVTRTHFTLVFNPLQAILSHHLLPLCTYSEVYLFQCFRKTSKTSPLQLHL